MKKSNKNVPDPSSSAPVADVEVLDAADEDSSLDPLEELDEDSLDQGEILDVGEDGPMGQSAALSARGEPFPHAQARGRARAGRAGARSQ